MDLSVLDVLRDELGIYLCRQSETDDFNQTKALNREGSSVLTREKQSSHPRHRAGLFYPNSRWKAPKTLGTWRKRSS